MSLLSQLTALELIPIITTHIIIIRCINLVLIVSVYIIHVDAYTGHHQSYMYMAIHIKLAHLIRSLAASMQSDGYAADFVIQVTFWALNMTMHDEDN